MLFQRRYRPLIGLDITTSSIKLIELTRSGDTYRVESWHARAVFTTLTRSAARYESFLRAIGPVAPGAAWASAEDEATVTAIAGAAQTTVLGRPGALPPGLEHSAHAA